VHTNVEQLAILDVGHGNSAAYIGPEGCVIIDGGRDYTLAEYLEARGVVVIDTILISHADDDHLRGILLLLEANSNLKVRRIYVNPEQYRRTDIWLSFSRELRRLFAAGTEIITALTRSHPGSISLARAVFEVLAPPPTEILTEAKPNRWSAVIRFLFDGLPIALFAGDVDRVGMNEILQANTDISAAILVFPHHGGLPGGANPETFARDVVKAVRPHLTVFSIGRSSFKNPNLAVLQGVLDVAAEGSRVACTQLSRHCSARSFSERSVHPQSAGLASGSSCMGTLELDLPIALTSDVLSVGAVKKHAAFVRALATEQTPCCGPLNLTASLST
jgi:beta-lactamase superfamily II metal-dependent hydrolase